MERSFSSRTTLPWLMLILKLAIGICVMSKLTSTLNENGKLNFTAVKTSQTKWQPKMFKDLWSNKIFKKQVPVGALINVHVLIHGS